MHSLWVPAAGWEVVPPTVSLPRTHHNMGGLAQQGCILLRFWRPESTVKMVSGLVPSGAPEAVSVCCLCSKCGWLPAAPSIPALWLPHSNLCLHFPFPWPPPLPFTYKDTCHWM